MEGGNNQPARLESDLKDFFIEVREHFKKWETKLDEMFSYMKGLQKLSEQYRLVTSDDWERNYALDEKFPSLSKCLVLKILDCLEKELMEIRKRQDELDELNNLLLRKRDKVEKSLFNQDLSILTSYGVCLPPFNDLVKYVENFTRFFSGLYLQLDMVLAKLDYNEEVSILELQDILLQCRKIHGDIEIMMALTHQFTV